MRTFCNAIAVTVLVCLAARGSAQPASADSGDVDAAVQRMFEFDSDADGKLTREELTDERLSRLFERADADADGVLTTEELRARLTRESAERPRRGARFGAGPGGPDGPPRGDPGGFGPGGPPPGGPGGPGPGSPPQVIGRVLPEFMIEQLQLSERQRRQLQRLQAQVDARLAEILTEEQKAQLDRLGRRAPGEGPPRRERRGGPDGFREAPPPRDPPARPDGPR